MRYTPKDEKPTCPKCGGKMKLHQPRPGTGQTFAPFWGCVNYPDCKGKINIGDDYDNVTYSLDYQ